MNYTWVMPFMRRVEMTPTLPSKESLTDLIYRLNNLARKERDKDKKYRLKAIKDEIKQLKQQL